jgi:hypothetical protein
VKLISTLIKTQVWQFLRIFVTKTTNFGDNPVLEVPANRSELIKTHKSGSA